MTIKNIKDEKAKIREVTKEKRKKKLNQ